MIATNSPCYISSMQELSVWWCSPSRVGKCCYLVIYACYGLLNLIHLSKRVTGKFNKIFNPSLGLYFQVLKERGIDDVALSNQNLGQSPKK